MQDYRRMLLLVTELLVLTRFTLVVGAVPLLALLATAQGRDLLAGLVEGAGPPLHMSPRGFWLMTALIVFACAAWYWAQKTLIPFKERLEAASPYGRLRFAAFTVQDWYPRAIAIVPMALVAAYGFSAGYKGFAAWIAAAAVLLTVFFYARRPALRWIARTKLSVLAPLADRPHQERAASLREFYSRRFMGAHFWLALSLILTIVFAVVVIPLRSPGLPQALGTPAIAFLWAAAAIPVGTMIAVLASTWRKPLLLLSVLGVMLVSCVQSDLNAPRVLKSYLQDPTSDRGAQQQRIAAEVYGTTDMRAGAIDTARCRFPETSGTDPWTPLSRFACAWIVERIDAGAPLSTAKTGTRADKVFTVVLVSAEGGGIRAALWTAAGLSRLRDRPGDPDRGFVDRIFAMSGASGGSLGIGVFTALHADDLRCGRPRADSLPRAIELLDRDFLAPTVAGYLFTDLVRPVGRFPWLDGDRVAYLERAWEDSYARTYAKADPDCKRNALGEPFDSLWGGAGASRVPLLFLNTTQVHDGRRGVVAPAAAFGRPNWIADDNRYCIKARTDEGPNAECFLDGFEHAVDVVELVRAPLALSTAIGLSARFPFVTSVANILAKDALLRQLADGGYFDNSATITLREIIDLLPTRVKRATPDGKEELIRIAPLVLHFVNDPDPAPTAQTPGSVGTIQSLAPLQTLESARSARNYVARIALHERVQSRGGYFVQIDMQGPLPAEEKAGGFGEAAPDECVPKRLKHSPPLGWVMSESTRKLIVDQATDTRALACVDSCIDWAMGKQGAMCPAQARPLPTEAVADGS
jgi:hypothetical protein